MLTALSLALLMGTIALWIRSYSFVDGIQFGRTYGLRKPDIWTGTGRVSGARLDVILTAPGQLYLFHRHVARPGSDPDQMKRMACFEGWRQSTWFIDKHSAVAKSNFAADTSWPKSGFHWRFERLLPGTITRTVPRVHKVNTDDTGVMLYFAMPMWFVFLLLSLLPAAFVDGVIRRRRNPSGEIKEVTSK